MSHRFKGGFTRVTVCAGFNLDMFQQASFSHNGTGSHLADLLDRVTQVSTRPRYAYMLLTLIAEIARHDGSAGPVVRCGDGHALLRDWLCDALTPVGRRDPRRMALAERVREELAKAGTLPKSKPEADEAVETEVRTRVRASGKTNLSRAVSELVAAGLMRRHYQGYRVDHQNRGAQRHAVYTLTGLSRVLLADGSNRRGSGAGRPSIQGELTF